MLFFNFRVLSCAVHRRSHGADTAERGVVLAGP